MPEGGFARGVGPGDQGGARAARQQQASWGAWGRAGARGPSWIIRRFYEADPVAPRSAPSQRPCRPSTSPRVPGAPAFAARAPRRFSPPPCPPVHAGPPAAGLRTGPGRLGGAAGGGARHGACGHAGGGIGISIGRRRSGIVCQRPCAAGQPAAEPAARWRRRAPAAADRAGRAPDRAPRHRRRGRRRGRVPPRRHADPRRPRLAYDSATDTANARGKVEIEQPGVRYRGSELQLQLQRFEGFSSSPSSSC
ncbi:hypothetical protein PEC18_00230 [Paucibacter sp. O1-1]|nr:hypothetical protein [Paucibacter sp. O1-1]MDA3824347.1 hypothetical protein [Paucibacter sp. O1-1]